MGVWQARKSGREEWDDVEGQGAWWGPLDCARAYAEAVAEDEEGVFPCEVDVEVVSEETDQVSAWRVRVESVLRTPWARRL